MEELVVKADEFGISNRSLVPGEILQIEFSYSPAAIDIETDGDDWIYLTTNGDDPVIGSGKCRHLPNFPSVRRVNIPTNFEDRDSPLILKLVSSGSPVISVEKQNRS